MELLRFLVLVPMVLWPAVNSQDQSSKTLAAAASLSVAAPSSSSPPLDEDRSSNVEEAEEKEREKEREDGDERSLLERLKTIPSGEEGLQLAVGDTAILECQLSIPSASHRFKSLSWTNTLTHVTMTTDNVTENSDKTMSVTLSNTSDNDNRTTTTSLVLTASSNLSAIGSTTPFRCNAEVASGKGEEEGKEIQATLNVTLVDPEWFCTFEGKANCEWKWGKSWKIKQSSATVAVGLDNCGHSISDHTYGPSNTVGQYLIAEFISESNPNTFEDTILSRTVRGHAQSKCIRFFYRLCQRIHSTDPVTVTIAKEDNATHTVHDIQPGDRWKEFSLPLPPYEKDYQIIIAVKYNNDMYVAIDDIKLESDGICKSEQAVAEVAAELLGPKSTAAVGTTQALTQSSTTVSSSSTSSSSSASSAPPPTSQSAVISSSETISHQMIPLTAVSEHPSTSGTQTSGTHRPTVSTVTASTSSSTAMQTAIANGLTSPSAASVKTTTTTLSPASSSPPKPSSATLAVVSLASVAPSSDRPRTEATAIPEVEGTFRPTSQEPGASDNDDDGDDDDGDEAGGGGGGASTADAVTNDNSTGLAIGIILAIMVAGACTAAILYRRRKNGKKSTYITFGNPSYSREHLPVNDFGLDSPLTLSSNGYTVLA